MSNPALFTTVLLDKPRRIRFRPGIARYRFGTIKKPLELSALSKPETFNTALCQWLFAVIDEDCELDSPESVAEAIENKSVDELVEIMRTLIDCVNMYKAPAESKNENGSTLSPSHASSSESEKKS